MKIRIMVLILLLMFSINVYADDGNINSKCEITIDGEEYPKISDGKYTSYINAEKEEILKIACDLPITHLYIYYDKNATKGLINNKIKIGENGFLHELIKLDGKEKSISLEYQDDYAISEINIFNTDTLPEWVEDWQILDKADLMLFSTHADDEQLFFAGLMPTYVDKGKKVQVIYFTNHYNNTNRYHEQLEGLWTVGVRYYPVISTFPDEYSESLEEAITKLEKSNYTWEDALIFEVEQLRKYKPLVVVGHDEKGEYGHGQHILNTDVLKQAIIKANDPDFDQESYSKYGTWNINKLYLHLYEENKLVLDYDQKLEHFNGQSAYEVSKKGFSKHRSQQQTWFTAWLNGNDNEYKSVTEIEKYNPAYYGLYYSSVGDDLKHVDMFENISPKKESPIIKETKNVIKKIKKETQKDHKGIIIGSLLIVSSIIGFLVIVSRAKHNDKKLKRN